MSSVSNTPVSQPLYNGLSTDAFFNGLAWDSNHGLFVPTDLPELIFDQPQSQISRLENE